MKYLNNNFNNFWFFLKKYITFKNLLYLKMKKILDLNEIHSHIYKYIYHNI